MFDLNQMDLSAELVALVERQCPDPGAETEFAELSPEDFEACAERLLAEFVDRPIWLFAYGSLIWNPDFEHVEHRRCTAFGWRRSYCLLDRRWRATPENPGLILALDHGGSCTGVAYRLAELDRKKQMIRLLEREACYEGDFDTIRLLPLRIDGRIVRALTFWVGPRSDPYFLDLPIREQARWLATAAGLFGSAAQYLRNTVLRLGEHGIHDSYLWKLQALVAEEIRRVHGISGLSPDVALVASTAALAASAGEALLPTSEAGSEAR